MHKQVRRSQVPNCYNTQNLHLFWLIGHHPESAVLEFPLPFMYITRKRPASSPELMNEYKKHWEQAVVTHPRDAAVLSHAAMAFGSVDPNLGLPHARKAVELDPSCKQCRELLGSLYGFAVLRITSNSDGGVTCLPKTPDTDQIVSALRREMESSYDPETLVSAGLTIRGYSGFYGQSCGGNTDWAAQFGMKLVRKAVGLDPSLIDRLKLRDLLNSSP